MDKCQIWRREISFHGIPKMGCTCFICRGVALEDTDPQRSLVKGMHPVLALECSLEPVCFASCRLLKKRRLSPQRRVLHNKRVNIQQTPLPTSIEPTRGFLFKGSLPPPPPHPRPQNFTKVLLLFVAIFRVWRCLLKWGTPLWSGSLVEVSCRPCLRVFRSQLARAHGCHSCALRACERRARSAPKFGTR